MISVALGIGDLPTTTVMVAITIFPNPLLTVNSLAVSPLEIALGNILKTIGLLCTFGCWSDLSLHHPSC